jgi:hypothetical protein
MKNNKVIKIHYPDGVHGWGIEFEGLIHIPYTYDLDYFSYSAIRQFAEKNCPKELHHFYQGGFAIPENSHGWAFLELWGANEYPDLYFKFLDDISKKFNIEVTE